MGGGDWMNLRREVKVMNIKYSLTGGWFLERNKEKCILKKQVQQMMMSIRLDMY